MTQMEAASPPLPFPVSAVQRLRGHPSGLKGRCRDRCATGLRPALDPGGICGPSRAAAGAGAKPLPARRHGAHDQVPTNRVSTVTGHCLNLVDEASARSAIAETNHDPQPTTP